METVIRLVVGVLLIGHGLVHLLWLTPQEDAAWPFRLDRSWLAPARARRRVAIALIAPTVATFALAGLAVWGVPGLVTIWPVLTVAGAVASLAMLTVFWDRRLVVGVAIDLALLVIALSRPGWTDRLG